MRYIKGDATYPIGEGTKIIAQICNDVGAWGAGFVLALSKKWEQPEKEYRRFVQSDTFKLGEIQIVPVGDNIFVVNMIAQRGISDSKVAGIYDKDLTVPPIRYDALDECLLKLNDVAQRFLASVHMPKIGTGLAGGDWGIISALIEKRLSGREVIIYEWGK